MHSYSRSASIFAMNIYKRSKKPGPHRILQHDLALSWGGEEYLAALLRFSTGGFGVLSDLTHCRVGYYDCNLAVPASGSTRATMAFGVRNVSCSTTT